MKKIKDKLHNKIIVFSIITIFIIVMISIQPKYYEVYVDIPRKLNYDTWEDEGLRFYKYGVLTEGFFVNSFVYSIDHKNHPEEKDNYKYKIILRYEKNFEVLYEFDKNTFLNIIENEDNKEKIIKKMLKNKNNLNFCILNKKDELTNDNISEVCYKMRLERW